jgi:radical SAM-linked protein
LISAAFRKGARLDAWEEHFDRKVWREAIAEAGWPVVEATLGNRDTDGSLPWDGIDLGVSGKALLSERKRSKRGAMTEPCSEHCTHLCGVCSGLQGVQRRRYDLPSAAAPPALPDRESAGRIILAFSRTGKAVFYSHLDMMTIFERSVLRAKIIPAFSSGFNPKPRMEFASPLAVGISSEQEILSMDLYTQSGTEDLLSRLNQALPEGIAVSRGEFAEKGEKRRSLMSLYWGSTYRIGSEEGGEAWDRLSRFLLSRKAAGDSAKADDFADIQEVTADGESLLVCHRLMPGRPSSLLKRLSGMLQQRPFAWGIRFHRVATWARNPSGEKASYFDLLT